MPTFKIKLEDKAAFLNRLEKAEVALGTNQIKDNKLEGYFTVTSNDSEQVEIIKQILKQSPKINTIKEMKSKLTRSDLKEMVRKELRTVLAENEEKEQMDESVLSDPNFIAGLATLLGVGGSLAGSILSSLKKAKTPEEKKKVLQQAAASIERTKGV